MNSVQGHDYEKQAKEMMRTAGPTMVLDIERPPATAGDGRTVSEQTVEFVTKTTGQWLMSRVLRRYKRTGQFETRRVKVEIKVTLDGKEDEEGRYYPTWEMQ